MLSFSICTFSSDGRRISGHCATERSLARAYRVKNHCSIDTIVVAMNMWSTHRCVLAHYVFGLSSAVTNHDRSMVRPFVAAKHVTVAFYLLIFLSFYSYFYCRLPNVVHIAQSSASLATSFDVHNILRSRWIIDRHQAPQWPMCVCVCSESTVRPNGFCPS